MGLLDRLFSRDPERALDRADRHLAQGEAARALAIATAVDTSRYGALRQRAEELAQRARRALLDSALAQAGNAEENEYYEDAAEWIRGGLDHAEDTERQRLEDRLAALEARARELAAEALDFSPIPAASAPTEPTPDAAPENAYTTWAETLREPIATLYADRPDAFRRAVVDLNEGRGDEALAPLDRLVEEAPEDPILRFERGRCRLWNGDAEGAGGDLEAAWEHLGDEPIDLAGLISLPALWAEALLAQEEPAEVVARLAELADPATDRQDLALPYGQALTAAGSLERARDHYASAVQRFGGPDLTHALARVLHRLGDTGQAIAVLEQTLRRACAGGGCARPALHLPSLKSLVALRLEARDGPDRVRELFELLQGAQGGLTADDFDHLAELHRQLGDASGAAAAEKEAEALRLAPPHEAGAAPIPADLGTKRAVL